MPTEKERLDILEPIVADLAQKQDRTLGLVHTLVDQVSLHGVKIDDLTARANQHDIKIEKVANGLARLTVEVSDLRQEMRQRFEQVDKRFEQIDKRFEQIDKRFEAIDKRFEQVDKRFDSLESNVSSIRQTQEAILLLLKEKLK